MRMIIGLIVFLLLYGLFYIFCEVFLPYLPEYSVFIFIAIAILIYYPLSREKPSLFVRFVVASTNFIYNKFFNPTNHWDMIDDIKMQFDIKHRSLNNLAFYDNVENAVKFGKSDNFSYISKDLFLLTYEKFGLTLNFDDEGFLNFSISFIEKPSVNTKDSANPITLNIVNASKQELTVNCNTKEEDIEQLLGKPFDRFESESTDGIITCQYLVDNVIFILDYNQEGNLILLEAGDGEDAE